MLYRFKQFIILFGDLILLYLSLFLALLIRYQQHPWNRFSELLSDFLPLFLIGAVIFYIASLYDISKKRSWGELLQASLLSCLAWMFFGFAYFYFQQSPVGSPKTILFLTAVFYAFLTALWRQIHLHYLAKNVLNTKTIIIGITPASLETAEILHREPERGYELCGFVENDPDKKLSSELSVYPVFSTISALKEKCKKINLIVFCPENTGKEELAAEIYTEFFSGAGISNLSDFYEKLFGRLPPFVFSQTWFLNNLPEQEKKIYDRVKIILDYGAAVLMGLFFIITFPIVAFLIKTTSQGPLFFTQTRTGIFGKSFKMYKYRTMRALNSDGSAETSGPQYAQKKDVRITAVGKFLRATRIDEIPQFINILKNEMSLIGPRPERPEFVEELIKALPYYRLRHLTKPGLTGWAQLHNSYYGSIEENLKKLEYDLYYIKHRSPMLDLMIILKTVAVVLKMMGR
ncbi:MAG TPA: sugar transferase [Candidatus Magasanikbacteria bacterium]|nr:sugar transferase [Candidatus Magasanikbacteria bacterium]